MSDIWSLKSLSLKRASSRFVILSGEKRRMRDNECQNSCDLSHRSRRSRHHHSYFLIQGKRSSLIQRPHAPRANPNPLSFIC